MHFFLHFHVSILFRMQQGHGQFIIGWSHLSLCPFWLPFRVLLFRYTFNALVPLVNYIAFLIKPIDWMDIERYWSWRIEWVADYLTICLPNRQESVIGQSDRAEGQWSELCTGRGSTMKRRTCRKLMWCCTRFQIIPSTIIFSSRWRWAVKRRRSHNNCVRVDGEKSANYTKDHDFPTRR